MPQIARLPLTPEQLAELTYDDRERFTHGFRLACRTVATLEGAPDECRHKPCRETGLCHLDYGRKWELFCPGSNSPHLERFGAGLLVVVADFIAEFVRGPGPDDAAPGEPESKSGPGRRLLDPFLK